MHSVHGCFHVPTCRIALGTASNFSELKKEKTQNLVRAVCHNLGCSATRDGVPARVGTAERHRRWTELCDCLFATFRIVLRSREV
jgi:hypothetical protein